jgi:hypothetical protein
MSFTEMKIGNVVPAKSITASYGDGKTSVSATFKAHKGERFVFLLLGVETPDNPMDPNEALKSFGWVPGSNVETTKG